VLALGVRPLHWEGGWLVLSSAAEDIADDLYRYGDAETACWVLCCSEDDLVKVCSVANWLLYNGPGQKSGASMMIAKACALAAVYVREGAPRDLARKTRAGVDAKTMGHVRVSAAGRRPKYALQQAAPVDYGLGQDAVEFWKRTSK
jgi:hypothetical protein